MGVVGRLISRHLTAYQLGHLDTVWEPFFAGSAADPRNGTAEIITSSVSKARSEEHTSELQSLMRISYAVFCLKKKTKHQHNQQPTITTKTNQSTTHTSTIHRHLNKQKTI